MLNIFAAARNVVAQLNGFAGDLAQGRQLFRAQMGMDEPEALQTIEAGPVVAGNLTDEGDGDGSWDDEPAPTKPRKSKKKKS